MSILISIDDSGVEKERVYALQSTADAVTELLDELGIAYTVQKVVPDAVVKLVYKLEFDFTETLREEVQEGHSEPNMTPTQIRDWAIANVEDFDFNKRYMNAVVVTVDGVDA